MSLHEGAGRTRVTRELFEYAVQNRIEPLQLACFDVDKPDLVELEGLELFSSQEVFAEQPIIINAKCCYCGVCSNWCPEKALQFNKFIPSVTLIKSRCYVCGKCAQACNRKGIELQKVLLGEIIQGVIEGCSFIAAKANESCGFTVPLINNLQKGIDKDSTVLCDFAPGIGSAVKLGLKEMDIAVVIVVPVATWEEGLADMIRVIKEINVRPVIILNKLTENNEYDHEVLAFCAKHSVSFIGIVLFTSAWMELFEETISPELQHTKRQLSIIWAELFKNDS